MSNYTIDCIMWIHLISKIFNFSYIIWCGDLNFRLEENSYNYEEICRLIQEEKYESLLCKDQLRIAMKEELAFHELKELPPTFPPTYKFDIAAADYSKKYIVVVYFLF